MFLVVVVLAVWLVLGGVFSLVLSRVVRERDHRSSRPLGARGLELAPLNAVNPLL